MIRVVTGPTHSRLAAFSAQIVAMGASTVHRFCSCSTPCRLEGSAVVVKVLVREEGDLTPGYVTAMMIGRAVCRAK